MRTASTGFLVDTNVLVYAYDVRDAAKQARAIDVLERMEENQLGALSVPILGEFFVTITRKLSQPFTPLEAERRVNSFVRSWLVLDITEAMVVEAVRGVSLHKWSYWDSLVWATVKVNGCSHRNERGFQ